MPRTVKATCRKCGETFTLNIGENTLEEAIEVLKSRKGFECPSGKHSEKGSPADYWTLHPETLQDSDQ